MRMTRLVPMLPVRDLEESVAFYRRLGFEVRQRNDDWGWASLAFGDCALMLDRSIAPHPHAPNGGVLYLYPDDVAAYHARLQAEGIDVPSVETTFYGMREFRIEDPAGTRLWIGQPVA